MNSSCAVMIPLHIYIITLKNIYLQLLQDAIKNYCKQIKRYPHVMNLRGCIYIYTLCVGLPSVSICTQDSIRICIYCFEYITLEVHCSCNICLCSSINYIYIRVLWVLIVLFAYSLCSTNNSLMWCVCLYVFVRVSVCVCSLCVFLVITLCIAFLY